MSPLTSKAETHFADTTIVYYRFDNSHSLLKRAVRDAVGNGTTVTSLFVRGEFIRGYVVGLIELYYAIKEERSVRDGIAHFSAQMGNRHPRKVANAFTSTLGWLSGLEDATDVAKTLRRLGEYIRSTLFRFDQAFPRRSSDPLRCEIGLLSFPHETYRESLIEEFYEEYVQTREQPACDQCQFRTEQQQQLAKHSIDLYGPGQQTRYSKQKGYVQQAQRMDQAVRSKKTEPSCWYCDRLGDTIIALSTPPGTTILTGDKQSFPALAEILGKPLKLIPALAELRQAPGPQED